MRNGMEGNGSGFPGVPRRSGEVGLYAVPRLEELAADPSKAGVLDTRTARIVAAKALGVLAASLFRLLEADAASDANQYAFRAQRNGSGAGCAAPASLDDVLKVEEAAAILGKPRRWIIRNAAELPFVTRVTRKHYICSRRALQRWLATRPHPPRKP